MNSKTRLARALIAVALSLALAACAPKVGSERWCEVMGDKAKGEWTANDATAYAKHCVLGIEPDE